MTAKAHLTLSEIFAKTNKVSHGPFKIHKKAHQDIKEAHFTMKGVPVKLTASEMKVMALLLHQKGGDVTISMMARGMDTPRYDLLYRILQDNNETLEERRAAIGLRPAANVEKCLDLSPRQAAISLDIDFKSLVNLVKKAIGRTVEQHPEKLKGISYNFESLTPSGRYNEGREKGVRLRVEKDQKPTSPGPAATIC